MKEIKPDYRLVKFDERAYWRKDLQEKTTEIYGVYLVDLNLHVHICSATPSSEMWFVANEAVPVEGLSEEDLEFLLDEISSAYDEPVTYMDARDIEKYVLDNPELTQTLTPDPEAAGTAEKVAELAVEGWADGSLQW